jgi:hypothetical protein
MFIKKSVVQVVSVIKDDEHQIDDEGTREALQRANRETEAKAILERTSAPKEPRTEN